MRGISPDSFGISATFRRLRAGKLQFSRSTLALGDLDKNIYLSVSRKSSRVLRGTGTRQREIVMTEDGGVVPQRDDKDDHDLLTYSEAGVRLHQEIEALEQRVRELTASGGSEALAATQARLTILKDARDRNSRRPINDENFEKFFGYKGVARRNT